MEAKRRQGRSIQQRSTNVEDSKRSEKKKKKRRKEGKKERKKEREEVVEVREERKTGRNREGEFRGRRGCTWYRTVTRPGTSGRLTKLQGALSQPPKVKIHGSGGAGSSTLVR